MENLPKTENKHENRDGEQMAELEAAVNQLDAHATQLEREGSEVDISEETAERVEKKAGKIKSLLKAASMALALYGTYDVGSYATSRYEITTEASQDGKIEYEHEDPETTRILNFLTGRSELSPEDKIHFYRELIRSEKKRFESILGEGWMDIDEQNSFENNLPEDEEVLRANLRDLYLKTDKILYGEAQGDVEKRVDDAFVQSVSFRMEYNPDIEKLVWDLQQKVGAPRIRWAAPKGNVWSQVHGHFAGPGRANYLPYDNTIYITPSSSESLGAVLFAEDAHALQFNEYPISSRAGSVVDTVETVIRSVRENKSMYESQLEEYQDPGSIEYEAHKIIEERLKNEFMEEGERLRGE